MMVNMHPNEVPAVLSHYRAANNARQYTPRLLPGTSNEYISDTGTFFAGPPSSEGPGVNDEPDATCAPAWNGNVPPNCDKTGPFRRAYSPPSYAGAAATITLPATNSGMPEGPTPINGDTGYIYFEGWPPATVDPGQPNSEFGLQYSAVQNWYTPYMKTNYKNSTTQFIENSNVQSMSFAAGDPLAIAVYAYFTYVPGTTCTSGPCFMGDMVDTNPNCPNSGYLCSQQFAFQNPDYSGNCCFWARMTTIGQTANHFTDGSIFNNIAWTGAGLDTFTAPNVYSVTPWVNGGAQSWPNDKTKIITTNYKVNQETDEIYLHS